MDIPRKYRMRLESDRPGQFHSLSNPIRLWGC
jgi:hypothetical protein